MPWKLDTTPHSLDTIARIRGGGEEETEGPQYPSLAFLFSGGGLERLEGPLRCPMPSYATVGTPRMVSDGPDS